MPVSGILEAKNATSSPFYTDSTMAYAQYYRYASGFSATTSGGWGSASGGDSLVHTITNTGINATLTHGSTTIDDGMGGVIDSGEPNVLTYRPRPVLNVQPNTSFALGQLTMLNGTTFNQSEATGATLNISLTFASPNVEVKNVALNFSFINTDNSSDRLDSADIIQLNNPNTGLTVTSDGVTYTLELEWVSLDPGAGVVQGNQFLVFEGSTARAELRAKLVPNR
jgi:hypothetical protein